MMETDIMVGTGMKLTCSREEFVARLGVVSRAVSTRGSVQILAGVLLRASNGILELAATDMELSLRTSLEADIEGEGSVVVPGRLLVDLARLLPDAEVQLEHRADEGVLTGELPAAHVQRRGLSALARDRRHADLHRRRGGAARDRGAGVALGLP